MPEMGGDELFPLLREARPEMRILLCTGHQRNETVQSLLDAGAVGLVPKPFDTRELGRQVRQALDGPA
jgi:DNA-binding NarL/FixJ family response regulator